MSNQDPGELTFPFSETVLQLYQRAKSSKSLEERVSIMVELASVFAKEHDLTDPSATDSWHSYIEEFEQVELAYEQAGLRLSRLLIQTLDAFMDEKEVSPEALQNRLSRTVN